MERDMTSTALITGAGRRLGAEIARYLGARAFKVIVHARKAEADSVALVSEIVQNGGDAALVVGDLAVAAERDRIVREIGNATDGLDILVNNASEFAYDFPGHGDLGILERSLNIHVIVPFLLIEHFARQAREGRRLDVFNVLDQKLESLNPDYYSYTIGKAALRAITGCWQVSGTSHVRVFGIMPGNMYPSGPQTEEEFQASSKANLLRRAPAAADVCEAITFFHANPGIAAQDLVVDAGEHLTLRQRDPAFDRQFTSR